MERTHEVEEIQREMQQVRASLGTDVRSLAQRARETTDWRYHVRRHPWVCLGAVAAAGYLLVPQKKHVAVNGLDRAARNGDRVGAAVDSSGSISGAITSLVIRTLASALMRRGMDLLRPRATGKATPNADAKRRPSVEHPGRDEDVSDDDVPKSAQPW